MKRILGTCVVIIVITLSYMKVKEYYKPGGKMELGKIVIMMPELYQSHEERGNEWVEVAEKVWRVQQARKEYERIEEALLSRLKELSKGESSKGGGYVFSLIKRKGAVDYNAIPYLKSLDLEKFRKPEVQSWSLKQVQG